MNNQSKDRQNERAIEALLEAAGKAAGFTVRREPSVEGKRPDLYVHEHNMIIEVTRSHDALHHHRSLITTYHKDPHASCVSIKVDEMLSKLELRVNKKAKKYKEIVEDHKMAYVVAIRDDTIGSIYGRALELVFCRYSEAFFDDDGRIGYSEPSRSLFESRPHLSGILYTETHWDFPNYHGKGWGDDIDTVDENGRHPHTERDWYEEPEYYPRGHYFLSNPYADIPAKAECFPIAKELKEADLKAMYGHG